MDNKLTFTGGEPNMNEDDFLRIQRANRHFIHALYKDVGNCIISGCRTSVGGGVIDIDSGYILLDNEVLKVDSDFYIPNVGSNTEWRFVKVTTYEAGGDKTYINGTSHQTWQKNRAIVESVASLGINDLDVVNGRKLYASEWHQITGLSSDWALYSSSSTRALSIKSLSSGSIRIQGRVQALVDAPSSIIANITHFSIDYSHFFQTIISGSINDVRTGYVNQTGELNGGGFALLVTGDIVYVDIILSKD